MRSKPLESRTSLLIVAFLAGASMMSVELAASRVMAPAFGSGIYVWGSLIGMVMVALSCGYFLGGRVADKSKDRRVLFNALLFAGIAVSFVPFLGLQVVMASMLAGLRFGPILASLVLFTIPMCLLSMVSPMVIRFYARDLSTIGSSSGLVYAVSTAGSIFGTFFTAFVLLPELGTKATLLLNASVLFIAGFSMFLSLDKALLVILLIPGFFLNNIQDMGLEKIYGDVIYNGESEYNIIRVYDTPKYRMLKLDEEGVMQTYLVKNSILTGRYYDVYCVGPLLSRGKSVLFLGMAGGTAVKQLLNFYDVSVDAVELDPKVVDVAKEYFDVREGERLRIHVGDGRQYLRGAGKYDIIDVDTFTGGANIPFHMATYEFFQEAKGHMTGDGILMMNIVDQEPKKELTMSMAYTLKKVFPSVFVVNMGGNQIVIACKKKTTQSEFIRHLNTNKEGDLDEITNLVKSNLNEFNSKGKAVFTDDKSNIEELTFRTRSMNW